MRQKLSRFCDCLKLQMHLTRHKCQLPYLHPHVCLRAMRCFQLSVPVMYAVRANVRILTKDKVLCISPVKEYFVV